MERKTKSMITTHQSLAIKKYIEDFPIVAQSQIISACNLDCSRSTLCRFLKNNNIERIAASSGPLIRPINIAKRLAFALEMVEKSDEFIQSIFWTDEFTVQSWPNGEYVFYWTPRSEPGRVDLVSPKVQNGGVRVMFWGSMTWHAYGPIIELEGSQNQDTYITLLNDIVLPEFEASEVELVFQQDNAPCHKARRVMEFMEDKGLSTIEWPAQSPDLSPIEVLWNVLKMKLKARDPRPRTRPSIIVAIKEIWLELDDNIRKNLCMGFRDRMRECIKNKGHLTRF
jgi:transposase